MKKEPIIVILGHTLLIEGVSVSLKSQENLCVYRIEDPGDDLDERLRSLLPDLIIFELEDPGSSDCLDLLKKKAEVSFVGLDQKNSQLIVMNRTQRNSSNMQDFIQIIQDIVR